ncbi:Hydroxyethylthiazole kinase [Auxenochlorella protothecoides]|nr:Hydroxyethylthiazole kinase [Auxenochlorella protothecoides]KFM23834.1 Hydroxyethylthiazole kinase [Auxenochlorella protothecoides]RMZ54817.1 hypothetical protein APUTEX25_000334 [Auxenochlorella protothecoides]|eukprot:RMZ54817.1 hypothetical protein APUTEX25_000334 [Auxenochlorella protothecoides]
MGLTGRATALLLEKCREENPLVQCITNFVSMDLMANTLLAAGASPAMAHSISEVESFVELASALLVNVGTLSEDWAGGMKLAALTAGRLRKPWVLDPVACGATPARTSLCKDLMALGPTVIRGNASEIMALASLGGERTRGVDSSHPSEAAAPMARALAARQGCIVAVSGAVDVVTDGTRTLLVGNGHPLLQKVTATGCSVTALIAAFVAVAGPEQALEATAHALAYFGVAAERAAVDEAGQVRGPGSFRVKLLDELDLLCAAQLVHASRIGRST